MGYGGKQFDRCPSCIAPVKDGLLDPEGNVCANCGHIFSAAAAVKEDYPRTGWHLNDGKKPEAEAPAAPDPQLSLFAQGKPR